MVRVVRAPGLQIQGVGSKALDAGKWELIKRHVKPKQKNKTCPPIQVNLCYFICCMVKFTCNLNSMYTELNPVYLACILIQQAWNITDSMIY